MRRPCMISLSLSLFLFLSPRVRMPVLTAGASQQRGRGWGRGSGAGRADPPDKLQGPHEFHHKGTGQDKVDELAGAFSLSRAIRFVRSCHRAQHPVLVIRQRAKITCAVNVVIIPVLCMCACACLYTWVVAWIPTANRCGRRSSGSCTPRGSFSSQGCFTPPQVCAPPSRTPRRLNCETVRNWVHGTHHCIMEPLKKTEEPEASYLLHSVPAESHLVDLAHKIRMACISPGPLQRKR
jgi:hypothetical protein